MQILAHRGYWLQDEEKNTLTAFQRAFDNGFGVETDVRDFRGKLVISHNVAEEGCLEFIAFADLYVKYGNNLPLALNVKADGLQEMLKSELKLYGIDNYFMFDMSVPEQVIYFREGFHTFSRQSEFEREVSMYKESEGIWMDEFQTSWITEEIIDMHLGNGKRLGIISPEIHHNKVDRLWSIISKFQENNKLMLCTDEPMKARSFLNDKNQRDTI